MDSGSALPFVCSLCGCPKYALEDVRARGLLAPSGLGRRRQSAAHARVSLGSACAYFSYGVFRQGVAQCDRTCRTNMEYMEIGAPRKNKRTKTHKRDMYGDLEH